MGIIINGKKYKFNTNVRLGILEMMEKGDIAEVRKLKIVLKELLIPHPTSKELFNFKQTDTSKIFKGFGSAAREESTETKKKLST